MENNGIDKTKGFVEDLGAEEVGGILMCYLREQIVNIQDGGHQ